VIIDVHTWLHDVRPLLAWSARLQTQDGGILDSCLHR
jgi:hypothetical protein